MAGKSTKANLGKTSLHIFYGLLAYMPFHVFLSTWLGSSTGFIEAAKVIKEPVMIVGFLCAVIAAKDQITELIQRYKTLFWLIFSFVALSIATIILRPNEVDAEILGLVYNTRFLVFFLYGLLLYKIFGKKIVPKATKLVLISGILVALLGIFQVMALPDDTLKSFGYAKDTGTPATFYISPTTKETERAYATLKDPNSLGSYLVIIISAVLVAVITRLRNKTGVGRNALGLVVLLACLYLTYSRSALVGLVAALVVLTLLMPEVRQMFFSGKRKYFTIAFIATLPLVALYLLNGTYFFRSVILHDVEGKQTTSNTLRLSAYDKGLDEIRQNPLGYGVGAAGPVSFKNESRGAMIPENYYIQMALEVGVVGLALFLMVIIVAAYYLFQLGLSGNNLAIALLASLAALSVANMFNHLWSNEAIAYVWWGLAGLVLASKESSKSA